MKNENENLSPVRLGPSEIAINAWLDRIVAALEKYALNYALGNGPAQPPRIKSGPSESWIMSRIIRPLRADFAALVRVVQS